LVLADGILEGAPGRLALSPLSGELPALPVPVLVLVGGLKLLLVRRP
jgi:hypothetical protein